MKISLILPIFDRRHAGWGALQSALAQSFDRRAYEVIAVVGRPPERDAAAEALLRQCDVVVHADLDPSLPEHEIPFLLAGYRRTTGDVLLFTEGHTVLDPECCTIIAEHFRDHPRSRLAWAPRIHRNASRLGKLIQLHSKHHEQLARQRGGFWLGANSVITRELFERLGTLDDRYMRFAERVLCERAVRENVPIDILPAPLATHYDDMPLSQLLDITTATGVAKFRYYNASAAEGTPVRVRHWIYPLANHDAIAVLLLPVARVLGFVLLCTAIALCRVRPRLAHRVYVPGLGFADLAGFCAARLRSARARVAAWARASARDTPA